MSNNIDQDHIACTYSNHKGVALATTLQLQYNLLNFKYDILYG
jgi:hypothetical protein